VKRSFKFIHLIQTALLTMKTFPCLGRREGKPCSKPTYFTFCNDDGCDPFDADFSIDPNHVVIVNNIDSAMDVNWRKESGITHVVSVCPLTYDEEMVIRPEHHFSHFIIPVQDDALEDLLIWLPRVVKWIQKALVPQHYENKFETICNDSPRVLIHCHVGMSRSVTVACAYVMRTTGMTPDEALHHVKWKRRIANPNPGFRRQLWSYHLTLEHAKAKRCQRFFHNIFERSVINIIVTYIFIPRRHR